MLRYAGTLTPERMSQNLSAIASALGGPASGHLVALHQLNEVIIATDGARVGAIVPYILNALAEAGPYEDFGGENEVAVLCVRAITNIVDMDPPACRFLAKPSALAVLQAHIVPSGGVSEVPEAVCKLLATTAVQYPQSVLRSGALATALSAFESLPEARRAVLQALVHATEKAREEWGAVVCKRTNKKIALSCTRRSAGVKTWRCC